MRERKSFLAVCVLVFAFALLAQAQDDSPSLGDVARQARLQKQQKDAQTQSADSDSAPAKDAQTSAQTSAVQNKDVQNNGAQDNIIQKKDNQNPNAPMPARPPKPGKHVITNDEIPSSGGPTGYRPPPGPRSWNTQPDPGTNQPASADGKLPADYWAAQIQSQKTAVASLQSQIDQVNDSIQYAGGNCVSGCQQWNEQQKQKQDQVESMKAQLEQQQKRLEDMQERARQQGYGSSVYDP
jgi:hypothetical protein